jgi:hypothetical protein
MGPNQNIGPLCQRLFALAAEIPNTPSPYLQNQMPIERVICTQHDTPFDGTVRPT